jgi:hypothetical protein
MTLIFRQQFQALHGRRDRRRGAYKSMERCAIFETGTGFAGAKLSEILPSARVARFVRMTWCRAIGGNKALG